MLIQVKTPSNDAINESPTLKPFAGTDKVPIPGPAMLDSTVVADTVALSLVWANKPYANGNGVNVDCFILYVVPESSTAYSAEIVYVIIIFDPLACKM